MTVKHQCTGGTSPSGRAQTHADCVLGLDWRQPVEPCGLVILRLGRLDGPLEFSACGRASGKADGAAFLAGKQGG